MKYTLVKIDFDNSYVIALISCKLIKEGDYFVVMGYIDKIYSNTSEFENSSILDTSRYIVFHEHILFKSNDLEEIEERAMLEVL